MRDLLWFRYNVQLDVLRQLEQKVKNLIVAQRKSSMSSALGAMSVPQTLTKLERDFERVQGLAHSAKAKVNRQQKQLQQRGAAIPVMEENSSSNALQLEQERFQMQLQQDVSSQGPDNFKILSKLTSQSRHCRNSRTPSLVSATALPLTPHFCLQTWMSYMIWTCTEIARRDHART